MAEGRMQSSFFCKNNPQASAQLLTEGFINAPATRQSRMGSSSDAAQVISANRGS
jgi:hypothetical protein